MSRDNLCTNRNTRARQWQGSKFMMDGWLLIALVFHNLQCMIHSSRVYYYYYYSQPSGLTGFGGLHTIISSTHARCNHHWSGLWLWAELHLVINIWQNPWLTCCVVSLWVIKSKHSTIESMYPGTAGSIRWNGLAVWVHQQRQYIPVKRRQIPISIGDTLHSRKRTLNTNNAINFISNNLLNKLLQAAEIRLWVLCAKRSV